MIKGVIYVFSGSFAAQIVALLALPVLTRIYSPAEFGYFQIVFSFTATIAPLAAMRYEMTLLRVKNLSDTYSALTLCLGINVVVAILVALSAPLVVGFLLNTNSITPWVYILIPLSFLANGIMGTLGRLPVRDGDYRAIANGKVLQTSTSHIGAIGFGGFFSASAGVLIFWDVIGRLLAAVYFFLNWRQKSPASLSHPSRTRMKRIAKAYARYPKFSVPASLLSALSASLPVLMLSKFYSPETVGQFSVAWRASVVPVAMLTFAISEVVNHHYSTTVRDRGSYSSFSLTHTIKLVVALAIPVLILLFTLGPPAIVFAFGVEWAFAGTLLQMMVPLVASTIISGPIGAVLSIAGRLDIQILWDLARFSTILIFCGCTAFLSFSAEYFVLGYSCIMLMYSIIYLALALKIKDSKK